MKIDLPLDAEALLSDGRRIKAVECGYSCTGCCLHDECDDFLVFLECQPCCRKDGRYIHFRLAKENDHEA